MGKRHHKIAAGLLAALVTGFLTAGCGQGGGAPEPRGNSSVPSEPSPSGPDSPSPSLPSSASPPDATSAPTPGGAAPSVASTDMTISGQVEAGVESGCLMLRTGTQLYQLMGGDKNVVKVGNNVVVRGHVVKGAISFCMQGTPFEVTEARLA